MEEFMRNCGSYDFNKSIDSQEKLVKHLEPYVIQDLKKQLETENFKEVNLETIKDVNMVVSTVDFLLDYYKDNRFDAISRALELLINNLIIKIKEKSNKNEYKDIRLYYLDGLHKERRAGFMITCVVR